MELRFIQNFCHDLAQRIEAYIRIIAYISENLGNIIMLKHTKLKRV